MFKICVICPEAEIVDQLEEFLNEESGFRLRVLSSIPTEEELIRSLRIHAPNALLISSSFGDEALNAVLQVRRTYPNLQVVVLCADRAASVLVPFMRAGVQETLFLPLNRQEVDEAMSRVRANGAGKDPIPKGAEVLCFLPAKPGAGASTIAVNTAAALARKGGKKVLLVDGDLGSGMVRFMLQIKHEHSLRDAAHRAGDLDHNLWPQLGTKMFDGLDILHAGGVSLSTTLEPSALLSLLDFWRRNYDVVCFDFSGNLEPFSIAVLREASKIFLVGTSEVAALHLLKEKIHILNVRDLAGRVYAIQNRRSSHDPLSPQQIEEVIGLPLYKIFHNHYAEVEAATREGRTVKAESALGIEFSEFAAQLRGEAAPVRKRSALREQLTAWKGKISKTQPMVEGQQSSKLSDRLGKFAFRASVEETQ